MQLKMTIIEYKVEHSQILATGKLQNSYFFVQIKCANIYYVQIMYMDVC